MAEFRDGIYSYLCYLLKNREDAEDVTQEVFIRLWNHWDRVDQARVKSWLMRVAHNRSIDLIRQKKTVVSQGRIMSPLEYVERSMSAEGTPETIYENNEKHAAILTALKQLPEKMHSILLMHYFQGMKYKEIGEILNITISDVKVSVHRGKKLLRDSMIMQEANCLMGAHDEV